jgi:hypothetical protein
MATARTRTDAAMRTGGLLGLAGLAVNVAILLLTPLLRPDVDVLRNGLSHYAVGPWWWLQSVGFVAFGAACAGIGLGLLRVGHGSRLPGVMLLVAALGFVGLAVFPMGRGGPMTPVGDLHLTAGTVAAVFQFAAVVAVAATNDRGRLGLPRRVVLGLGSAAAVAAALIQLAIWRPDLGLPEGLLARLAVAPLLVLWAMVARRLVATAGQPDAVVGPLGRPAASP